MTPRSEALLDALAAITGIPRPDAPTAVAAMSLTEVGELLERAGATDWPIQVLADVLEEIRELARHQTELDGSVFGRRHRGAL